jgi:hypothetical protein
MTIVNENIKNGHDQTQDGGSYGKKCFSMDEATLRVNEELAVGYGKMN